MGLRPPIVSTPQGTTEDVFEPGEFSFALSGLFLLFDLPTVETAGYFLPPLRGSKQRDADADTRALEREIDELVYARYGLPLEEIKLVEGGAK